MDIKDSLYRIKYRPAVLPEFGKFLVYIKLILMILFILLFCCLPLIGITFIHFHYLFVSPATILLLDKQMQFQKTVIIEDTFSGAAIIR